MNAFVLLLVASIAVSSAFAGGFRRRRDLLLSNNFMYPRDCDNKLRPCSFVSEWKNGSFGNVNFTITAKLDVNQWVGITWIRQVSLVGASFYTLSVTKGPLDGKPMAQLTKGIMDDQGVVHIASKQDDVSDAIVEYNEAQKLAVAHFSRDIHASASSDESDLSKCPIWVFLPEAGNVILPIDQSSVLTTIAPGQSQKVNKDQTTVSPGQKVPKDQVTTMAAGQKIPKGQKPGKDASASKNQQKAKFNMRSPEGSLFYMSNPKCL